MAILSGEATLTTTASFGTAEDVNLISAVDRSHTTLAKTPIAMLAIPTSGSGTAGWDPDNTGLDHLTITGSLATMQGLTEVEYTDSDYTAGGVYFTETEPLAYESSSIKTHISDKFVFDFSEIQQEATTNITSLTITATITGSNFSSGSSADIKIAGTSFGTSGLTDARTINEDTETTISWTTTGIGTGHSGSFLPANVHFNCDTDTGKFKFHDVTMQITFTGKTYLRSGAVENDSHTYKQINLGGTVTQGGVTYNTNDEIRIGSQPGQITTTTTFGTNGATDELAFNWNAGRFANIGEGFILKGMTIKEYIAMTIGAAGTSKYYSVIDGTARYTLSQDGSGQGNVFEGLVRRWAGDNGTGDGSANAIRNALAVPNFLHDDSISNADVTDVSTAISLSTKFQDADTNSTGGSNYTVNEQNEFDFRNGTKNSPTGNTGFFDKYGDDFDIPDHRFIDPTRDYRADSIPNNTKLFLELLWAPALTGFPDALDLSTTWTNSGLIGITHGLESGDVGTYTATSTVSAFGGFLLEAEATPTASFTADFRGGFQLSVIEEETTTATLAASAEVEMLASASITTTTTASIDGSLIFFPDWGVITPTFTYSQTDSGIGIIHGMTLSDVGAMAFAMTGVVVGSRVDEPDPFRTNTLIEQTRSIPVSASTRIATVDTQTRSIPVSAQTRIQTAETQTRTLKITGYNT